MNKPVLVKQIRKGPGAGRVWRGGVGGNRVSKAVEISKTAPLPKSTTGAAVVPCNYNGGRIYWSWSKLAFRVIRRVPIYASEAVIRWKGKRPIASEWKRALGAIDAYKKK